jgi:hypothetical protein
VQLLIVSAARLPLSYGYYVDEVLKVGVSELDGRGGGSLSGR